MQPQNQLYAHAIVGFLVLSVLAQQAYLKPILDGQIDAIVQGNNQPGTWHHIVYIILECGKLIALIALGIIALRKLVHAARNLERNNS